MKILEAAAPEVHTGPETVPMLTRQREETRNSKSIRYSTQKGLASAVGRISPSIYVVYGSHLAKLTVSKRFKRFISNLVML